MLTFNVNLKDFQIVLTIRQYQELAIKAINTPNFMLDTLKIEIEIGFRALTPTLAQILHL